MYQCHGSNPVLPFTHCFQRFFVLDISRLQIQQADDDLQIIFYAVVNLFQQKNSKSLGGRAFLECLLLLDWNSEIRLIRLGKSEAMVRDFHDGFTLLEKEYDSSVRNAKK